MSAACFLLFGSARRLFTPSLVIFSLPDITCLFVFQLGNLMISDKILWNEFLYDHQYFP